MTHTRFFHSNNDLNNWSKEFKPNDKPHEWLIEKHKYKDIMTTKD